MRRWLIWVGIVVALLVISLGTAAWLAARHFQPFARAQVIAYLHDRFGTDVALDSLHISISAGAPWRLETAVVHVRGTGLKLPPLITVGTFRLDAGISALWSHRRRIRRVALDQVVINVPPAEQRRSGTAGPAPAITVDEIRCQEVELRMLTSDPAKPPRVMHIHDLQLTGAGPGRPMHYRAALRNPTPPGDIQVAGEFGPWQRDDPGTTPITGSYQFRHADLGVFRRIAGILASDGKFSGVLRRIEVDGTTDTPDFRLAGGNPVPLRTRFHSVVDGTSGDTLLEPVDAVLGASRLVARGKVVRIPGAPRRTVKLDVVMSSGHMEDMLRLAMKRSQPLVTGNVGLRTRLDLLPVGQGFAERLILDGTFEMNQAQFTNLSVQQKIDSLSRRAQGQPENERIADVASSLRSGFHLRDGELRLSGLTFHVPGAAVHLNGNYGLYSEQIDFHGVARLRATVSQTMKGWKRIVLKPVDPFFSKAGAGTLLPIKVTGTTSHPEFGLDRGK